MFPTEKEVAKLIKKIQKKVSNNALAKQKVKKFADETLPPAEEISNEIFNEMKKLPYTS